MFRRIVATLFLLNLSAASVTVNLEGLRVELELPEGTAVYPAQTGAVLLLSSGGETLGVIHVYPAAVLDYGIEEITAFYSGDANAFLADLLADLRRAITRSNPGSALRWGGYNRTSARGACLASADYYDTAEDRGYYNLDSLLLLGERLVFVDGHCPVENAGRFREVVTAALSSISEHEGW
jgi:hypothetical protein